jgi:hypothetical protein
MSAFQSGADCGTEHCARGIYRPAFNPCVLGTPERSDWSDGYERGRDAAFYRKHERSDEAGPKLPLSNQTQS